MLIKRRSTTAERVRQLLNYDPETGKWTWRVARGCRRAGSGAGTVNGRYLTIKVDGVFYYAHVLALLYMTGEWPPDDVDHKDVDSSNCRWSNLRPATRTLNIANSSLRKDNASGCKGVSWHKAAGKWVARIGIGGQRIHLGCFDTIEAASSIYEKAAIAAFGSFARAS